MRELSDSDIRIKAAFRRAVEQAGGCIAVSRERGATRADKSHISNYCSPHHDLMPPVDIILAVERLAAEPFVTREMAEQWQHEMVPLERMSNEDTNIINSVADVALAAGDLQCFTLRAAADGRLTPNEKAGMRNRLERTKAQLRELEDFTAPQASLRSVS